MKILLGFRKLAVILLVILLSTIFLLTHHIDGKTFGDILKGTVVAFMASNASEHVINMIKTYFNNKDK